MSKSELINERDRAQTALLYLQRGQMSIMLGNLSLDLNPEFKQSLIKTLQTGLKKRLREINQELQCAVGG